MKKLLLTLVFIIAATFYATAKCTLEVHIQNCKYTTNQPWLSSFTLYKNDTFLKVVQVKDKNLLVLRKLDYGNYKIAYKTIFGKIEHIAIELTEKGTHTVAICLDYLNYEAEKYTPFIDRLKDGESFSIAILIQGCTNYLNDTLLVTRKLNNYYLNCNKTVKLLTNREVALIRNFEMELRYATSSADGNTTNSYILQYNNKQTGAVGFNNNWSLLHTYLYQQLNLTTKQCYKKDF